MWLGGLSTGVPTKRLPVHFPARARAWVVRQVANWGCVRGNQLKFSSLPLSLKINKSKSLKNKFVKAALGSLKGTRQERGLRGTQPHLRSLERLLCSQASPRFGKGGGRGEEQVRGYWGVKGSVPGGCESTPHGPLRRIPLSGQSRRGQASPLISSLRVTT